MRLPLAGCLLMVALAACGEVSEPPRTTVEPDRVARPAATATATAGAAISGLRWSDEGGALVLRDAREAEVVTLTCAGNPARVRLVAHGLRPVAIGETMQLRLGDARYGFAGVAGGADDGAAADAAASDDLLNRLAVADSFSVIRGRDWVGPHIPPDEPAARRFVAGCRDSRPG